MKKITKRTKMYIIPIVLEALLFVGYVITLIAMNILNPFNKAIIMDVILTVLIFAYPISIIISRVKRNQEEQQLNYKTYLEYESVKDILKYAVISKKEKQTILSSALNIFTKQKKDKVDKFNPKEYAYSSIEKLGYTKNIRVIINSGILAVLMLLFFQIEHYFTWTIFEHFYNVYLAVSSVVFAIVFAFFWINIYKNLFSKGKMFLANLIPLIAIILHFSFFIIVGEFNFDSAVMRYIFGGNFSFIRTDTRLIIFAVLLFLCFFTKAIFRRYFTKSKQ